ncbi:MAG TPA: hypothetical protein VGL53_22905 [Bryobacteraceae bacterium]|jgi:hypothetical protein
MIHRALFPDLPVDEAVVERYEQARARFFTGDRYAPMVAFLVENQLDLEAVEYALRLRVRGQNGLTQRFQVILTLCEVRSAYDSRFVQRHRLPLLLCWFGAPWLGVRALWKFTRGLYLIRIHRLRERFSV